MSILQTVETSPGRVRGLVRFLAGHASQRQPEAKLKALMSPSTLPLPRHASQEEDGGTVQKTGGGRAGGSAMLDKVVGACERMGLVCREDGAIFLNPELPAEARDEQTADRRLPLTICELIFDPKRDEEHELAQLIAWYLSRDPFSAPGDEKEVIAALQATPSLLQHFALNNLSYGQFEDWVVYLGFAWAGVGICPDPTSYLRRNVAALFDADPGAEVTAAELVRRIAEVCPVLEGGKHRADILRLAGIAESVGHLSPATSQAWLRLEREGFWTLLRQSDAGNPVVLVDGTESTQVAAVKIRSPRATKKRRAT